MIVSTVWLLIIIIISFFILDIKKLRYLSKFLAIHGIYYGNNLVYSFDYSKYINICYSYHQYIIYLNTRQ